MKATSRLFILFAVIALAAGIAVAQRDWTQGNDFATEGSLAIGDPTSISPALSSGVLDCSTLQKRRVRFSSPGWETDNSVGLFYNFEGVPAGPASLEIFWDEVGKPTERLFYALGEGEIQRNDDGLTDHTGIIQYAYSGVIATESKTVRANLIVRGFSGNCPTVRRVTVSPGSGGFSTPGSLTTVFNQNNENNAVLFDITAWTPLRVDSFGVNTKGASGPHDWYVYYRVGTSVGNGTTRDGWTLLGTASGVMHSAINTPTSVPVGGLVLVPGTVYGIWLELATLPLPQPHTDQLLAYTDAGGRNWYSNSDMTITTYAGVSSQDGTNWVTPPFTVSEYRTFNGTVHYTKE